MKTRIVYVITYSRLGGVITHCSLTLQAAKNTAASIYQKTGIVVGIDERREP